LLILFLYLTIVVEVKTDSSKCKF